MRKLFIILVGLIAVVTFIRAFDNFGGVNMNFSPEIHNEIKSEVFSSDLDSGRDQRPISDRSGAVNPY